MACSTIRLILNLYLNKKFQHFYCLNEDIQSGNLKTMISRKNQSSTKVNRPIKFMFTHIYGEILTAQNFTALLLKT
jgi:hypothetical protein